MIEKNKIKDILLKDVDDFIFDLMEIENFNNNTSRMRFWFNHTINKITALKGDIFEFGVYRGGALLSMALLLKKLNSDKKIYGFDSFSGFPSYSTQDDLDNFLNLFEQGEITEGHYNKHKLLMSIKKSNYNHNGRVGVSNISSSNDFSENSLLNLTHKIELLELDNITIIEGDFKDTVPKFFEKKHEIFSCNIDCDLYDGYKIALPYIYENLVVGGYIHLDEYYSIKFPGARIACNEFFNKMEITPIKQETPEYEFERWGVLKQ